MPLFSVFYSDLPKGVHKFGVGGDTFKVYLSNTINGSATSKSQILEISGGNGYVSGGIEVGNVVQSFSGKQSVIVNEQDIVITATGGSIPQFRYVIMYNTSNDSLVFYDTTAFPITLDDGEIYIIRFPDNKVLLTFE